MLRRKVYDKLMKWKFQDKKKALCIIGARQIGKSTIIRKFGEENYSVFVDINFVLLERAKEIFAGNFDAETIISNITAFTRQELIVGETLILLDEIQECPRARTAIKSLVQDGRFDFIESGSLLGVKHKEVNSYPVGFEEIYEMYPMDFEEFLWANNVQESTIKYLKDCFERLEPISQSIHGIMQDFFYTYSVVGGMPEVVQRYIDTSDIASVISFQRQILDLYRQDISKYSDDANKMKIKAIFDSISSQLNSSNRRFYLNHLKGSARIDHYENSFMWLSDAGVALPCYNVSSPQSPLKLNEKRSLFKLYMGDTGLLCAASMENIQFDLLQGNMEINMGSILENVMAQQLKSNGFNLNYYDSSKIGEIDFVVQNGMKIDLIEIKSGKNYKTHKALLNASGVKDWKFNKSIVFCKDNISKDNDIVYLPWYLIMFYKREEIAESLIHKVDISILDDFA